MSESVGICLFAIYKERSKMSDDRGDLAEGHFDHLFKVRAELV